MRSKPVSRQLGDLLQCSGLGEQVRGVRNYFDLLFTSEATQRLPIQIQNSQVISANNQERWALNTGQGVSREVGRPPRDTTACILLPNSAAATNAAAAPVLEPK